MSNPEHRSGAVLTVDLDAIVANWRSLCETAFPAACSAVVKADAYGLGMARVAPALAAAGCEVFFVALPDEAIRLRAMLPGAEIHVLCGVMAGTEGDLVENDLIPVINSPDQLDTWARFARRHDRPLPADLHMDTGMSRLGFTWDEWDSLAGNADRLAGIDVRYVISHLACADEREHGKNREQLDLFRRARARLPLGKASLANSGGIFLGGHYHFDLVRPGCALYGVDPQPTTPNPMAQVVHLQGRILQVREIDSPSTVGYGASFRVSGRGRIATVAAGYADGYLRSLGNRGSAYVGDVRAPVVGRVSMDLITVDVSEVPERLARPGRFVDLIGPHNPVDRIAEEAGTIGYEILTALGPRYHRVYVGADT